MKFKLLVIDSTKVLNKKEKQQIKSKVQTRGFADVCELHVYLVEQYYCTDAYWGDELLNTYCELAYSWMEEEWVCDVIEVPDEVCPNCGQNPCGCEESGDGEGGENGGANELVNNAKKLFKNNNMTEADWDKLSYLVCDIMYSCMGEVLYEDLLQFLNGNTISFNFTEKDGAGYNPHTNIIELNKDMGSSELFHELMHAYQYQNDPWVNATMNIEIEAHYAHYLYARGSCEYSGSSWEAGVKGGAPRILSITNLDEYVDKKGNLFDGTNIDLFETYWDYAVVSAFENDPVYKNFVYDKDHSCLSNFSNLNKIAQYC